LFNTYIYSYSHGLRKKNTPGIPWGFSYSLSWFGNHWIRFHSVAQRYSGKQVYTSTVKNNLWSNSNVCPLC